MSEDRPDRFAAGSGGDRDGDPGEAGRDDSRPGVTGGGANYLPTGAQTSDASSAEGTIGAAGEMDVTGAPAGTAGSGGVSGGGSSAGTTEGGGPGGGARSGGGTGPADAYQ